MEEGATGTVVTESISTEGVPSVGAPGVETISETTIVSQPNRTNVKYPKTKRVSGCVNVSVSFVD